MTDPTRPSNGPIYTPEDPNVIVVPEIPPRRQPPPAQTPTIPGQPRPNTDLAALAQLAFETFYDGIRGMDWNTTDRNIQQRFTNVASVIASAVIRGRPPTPVPPTR